MHKGDILLVQVYVDDIIFGSTKKELCFAFERLMDEKFQMSSMGELTFFLGLQVKHKKDEVKTASTSMETQKPLLKDEYGEKVDVHMYRSMIGSLMYLTSSRLDIMFTVCACARYQVNPKVSHLHVVKRIFSVRMRVTAITFIIAKTFVIRVRDVVKPRDKRKKISLKYPQQYYQLEPHNKDPPHHHYHADVLACRLNLLITKI
nr:hypothetical protein [Tanacetum cinerariifolium]